MSQPSRSTPAQRVSDSLLLDTAKLVARRALQGVDGLSVREAMLACFIAGYQFAHGMKIERKKRRKKK